MEDEILELIKIVAQEEENKESAADNSETYCGMLNQSFPEPALAHYWRDYRNRTIWIDTEINDDFIGVARNILRWNNEDIGIPVEERRPIRLFINSPGGVLTPTFAVCDAILSSKTPVYGINMHEACSAAALVFACCHKRAAADNAYFLLHLGSGGTLGTFQQSRAQQEDYNHKVNQMINLFKRQLGTSEELTQEIESYIDGEWYLYMDTPNNSRCDARRYNLVTDEMSTLLEDKESKI